MKTQRYPADARDHHDGCPGRHSLPAILFPVVILLLLATALRAGSPPPQGRGDVPGGAITPGEFRSRLDRALADPALARAVIGLKIVRLDDALTIASINSGALLHPASNMKLLTTAAAEAILPAGFVFRTRVYCDREIDGPVVHGSMYVVGGGDPLLDTLDVDSLAGMVAASGISRIEGDIVGDVGLFDTLSWGKGWMWDDEPDPDEPFITPLAFNDASVSVAVGPGPREGSPLVCRIRPAPDFFTLDNEGGTIAVDGQDSLAVTRERGADRIVVRGTMRRSSPEDTTSFSVRNPSLHFLHALREKLQSRGVTVGGAVRIGEAAGTVFLGQIERRIGPVLRRINKASDNFAAECLLKTLDARTHGAPGTSAGGIDAIRGYLAGVGIDSGATIIADGSGVSWYTVVTADDIIAVLRDQYARKSTFGEFHASLPKAGYDGTLGSRMAGGISAGRIAAKTGTLTGVSTLSGYVTTLSHDMLAFSILINHFPGKIQRLRALQDAILEDLVRLDPGR
jgi:D-alanyl-D-alanine carboxypeptidase/D-alanyl-D-alanine-endopeptidase (penicillin-binding protein 4)